MVGMVMMVVVVVIETDSPPTIRICPPGVIISPVVRIWVVIGPEIDLFARDHRVSVVHFTKRFDLLSLNLSGYRNPSPFPINVGI